MEAPLAEFDYDGQIGDLADLFLQGTGNDAPQEQQQEEEENENSQSGWARLVEPAATMPYQPPETGAIQTASEERSNQGAVVNRGQTLLAELSAQTGIPVEASDDLYQLAQAEYEDFDNGSVPEVSEPKQKKKRGAPRKKRTADEPALGEQPTDPLHQAPKANKRTKIRAAAGDTAQTDVAIHLIWFARLARKGYRLPSSAALVAQRVFHPGLLRNLKTQEEKDEALAGARSWPPEPVLDWFKRINRELEEELKALKKGAGVIQNLGEKYNKRKGIVTYLWRFFTLTSRRPIPSVGQEALVFLTEDYLESLIKSDNGVLLLVNQLQPNQLPEAIDLFAKTAFNKICNANKIGGRLNALKLLQQRDKLRDDELCSLLEEPSVDSKRLSTQQNTKLDRIAEAAGATLNRFQEITEFLIGEQHYRNNVVPIFGRALPLLSVFDVNKKIPKAPSRPDYYTRQGFLNGAIAWDADWTLERWNHANDPKRYRLTGVAATPVATPPLVTVETLPTLVNQQDQVTEALQDMLPTNVQPNPIAIAQLRQSVQIRDQTLLSATSDVAPEARPAIVHLMEAAIAAAAADNNNKKKRKQSEVSTTQQPPNSSTTKKSASSRIALERQTDAQVLTVHTPGTEAAMARTIYAFSMSRLRRALTNITLDPTPVNHRGLGPFVVLTIWLSLQEETTAKLETAIQQFDQLWQTRSAAIVEAGDPNTFEAIRVYWRGVLELLVSKKAKKIERDERKQSTVPPKKSRSDPQADANKQQQAAPQTPAPPPETLQENQGADDVPVPGSPLPLEEEGPRPPDFMLADVPESMRGEEKHPEDRITRDLIRFLMERVVNIRQAVLDDTYRQGIEMHIDAVRRALLVKNPPPPVSAFCIVCPWRIFHDGVFNASDPMRLRGANEYAFDTTSDYVAKDQLLAVLRHSSARQYIAANVQKIYQFYYALHLLASRTNKLADLENLIAYNVPLTKVFPTWHLQFVHYMQVTCQTAQYDRDGAFSRLQPFRRSVLYPPVATLQVLITCRDQERVASGVFDASEFDALFGVNHRTLLVRVRDRVTSVSKDYYFTEMRSQPQRLIFIDALSFGTSTVATAILKIDYSLPGGIEQVSLEPNGSAAIQIDGQLDLDVVVSIAESDARSGILSLRYSQLLSCRTAANIHELRQPVTFQQSAKNPYTVSFSERFPAVTVGTLIIREKAQDNHLVTFAGAAPADHPFFAHAALLPLGTEAPRMYPVANLTLGDVRRFALLLRPNRKVDPEMMDLYVYQLEAGEMRLVTGELPIRGIALSLRSIVIYNQSGQFAQELSVHMQGNRHYAVRAPCMLLVAGQKPQSVVRDAIVLTNNENDLTTFPLTIEAPMGIVDRAMTISSSVSLESVVATNESTKFKCDVCGSTKMIDARIYKGTGSPQQQQQHRVHKACGGACSKQILTTIYQL